MSATTRIVSVATACCAVLVAIAARPAGTSAQSPGPLTITLAGQSMIRSDIRTTAPAAVPVIQSLLKGDVVFTNFEAAIAQTGQTINEGRGFLARAAALDSLTGVGFNLLALSNNHAFDL